MKGKRETVGSGGKMFFLLTLNENNIKIRCIIMVKHIRPFVCGL